VGYSVVLSERFIDDLQGVVEYYTEKAGVEVAIRFGNELIDAALSLEGHPHAGKPVPSRSGARQVRHHAYLIFYDLFEEEERIEIITLWHGAQNPRKLEL